MNSNKNTVATALTWVAITLSLVVNALFAQEPTTPTLQCGEIIIADNQVTIPITVDFANNPIDTVRMEMVFDPAILSNPVAVKGADFNTNGIQAIEDNLFVATFGRSSMSDVEGSAHFATVTFDWTGEPTFVTFAELGQGIGQGTIAFIVGDKLPVDTTMCMIGENAPTPTPTPMNTTVPTPIPPPTNTHGITESLPLPPPNLYVEDTVVGPGHVAVYMLTLTSMVHTTPVVTVTIPNGSTFVSFDSYSEVNTLEQIGNQVIWQPIVAPATPPHQHGRPDRLVIWAEVDANAHELYDVVAITVEVDDGRTLSAPIILVSKPTQWIVSLDADSLEDMPDLYTGGEEPVGYDFGDLPNSYSTTGENAPSHEIQADGTQLMLGNSVTVEPDDYPASGVTIDEDDGVIPPFQFVAGTTQSFEVTVTGDLPPEGAVLGVWVDWDQNGQFTELEFARFDVTEGSTLIPVTPPSDYEPNVLAVRFRLFAGDNLPDGEVHWADFEGSVVNGEIEDYVLSAATAVTHQNTSATSTSTSTKALIIIGTVSLLIIQGVLERGRIRTIAHSLIDLDAER